MSEKNILVTSGRVRAGYEIGETLFEKADPSSFRGILHVIGERPGTVHHAYSIYFTVAKGSVRAQKKIDHDIAKLVSNVADTALTPKEAAGIVHSSSPQSKSSVYCRSPTPGV